MLEDRGEEDGRNNCVIREERKKREEIAHIKRICRGKERDKKEIDERRGKREGFRKGKEGEEKKGKNRCGGGN